MLRLEFYPGIPGLHMRAVGVDKNRNPDGSKKEGASIDRTIDVRNIDQLGLAGAIARALWELHQDFPDLHKYARR